MVKKKIILDTNILISALGWDGKPKEVFRRILNGELELIISPGQVEELQRVLEYPKFQFTEEQKSTFLTIVVETATLVETYDKVKVVGEDRSDNIILESAVEGKVDFIISGDEHLLKIKDYENVKIVTVAEFLELY